MPEQSDLPGLPGAIVNGARRIRKATNVFPPLGIGIGGGIGLGCGFGWPLRSAYGPPRALCGPAIAVGIGIGYGQGIGRRFGRDERSETFKKAVARIETTLDALVVRILALLGSIGNRPPKQVALRFTPEFHA